MCAEYGRKRRGQRTRTSMTRRQLMEFCTRYAKNTPVSLARLGQGILHEMTTHGISMEKAAAIAKRRLMQDPEVYELVTNIRLGVNHMRGKNPASNIHVEPPLNATDAKALKSYLRGLRKARPAYFHHGMRFEYRGSTVTISGDGKREATRRKKNPHLRSGKWQFLGMFEKRDIAQVKRILRVHGMKMKVTKDHYKQEPGMRELYVERGAFDTAYRAITQLFVSEKSYAA